MPLCYGARFPLYRLPPFYSTVAWCQDMSTPYSQPPSILLAPLTLPAAVRDLLEKNPHAKALQLPKLPPGGSAGAGSSRSGAAAGGKASREGSAAAGSEGGEEGGAAAAGAQRKRPAQKRKAAAEEAEKELLPDEQLPPRAAEMPVRVAVCRSTCRLVWAPACPCTGVRCYGGLSAAGFLHSLGPAAALKHVSIQSACPSRPAGGSPPRGTQGAGLRRCWRQAAPWWAGLVGSRAGRRSVGRVARCDVHGRWICCRSWH